MTKDEFDGLESSEVGSVVDAINDVLTTVLAMVAEDREVPVAEVVAMLRSTGASLFEALDDDQAAEMAVELCEELGGVCIRGRRGLDDEVIEPTKAVLASAHRVLEGRVLTHRLTESEAVSRLLSLDGALGVIDWDLFDNELVDERGEPITINGAATLEVPAWVDGLRAGSLIALSRHGFTVRFAVMDGDDVLADGNAEIAAVLEIMASACAGGVGAELTMELFDVLRDDPTLFNEPTPPIEELLRDNGYVDDGAWWGPDDVDWQTPGARLLANNAERAAARYGLAPQQNRNLGRLSDAWMSWLRAALNVGDSDADEPLFDGTELAELLDDDVIPLAFFDLHGQDFLRRPDAFASFVELVTEQEPDSVGSLLLAARHAEVLGDARRAETLYKRALRHDDANATALIRAMTAAIDASRFEDAARFMNRLFGPGSANEKTLRSYAAATMTASRNEPCPCGSGRKYKQCHADVPLLEEPAATRAIIFKLEQYAEQTVHAEVFGYSPDRELRASLVTNPVARDFLIHEGGLLERFLDDRIDLIPAGEVERLRNWQQGRRDLYEVVDVDPGLRLGVRNVRTGDRHDLLEYQGSLDATVGSYLLLRVEERDGIFSSYGAGANVAAAHRDRVLEMMDDPYVEDLLDWIIDLSAPPQLQTRDGEDLLDASALIASSLSAEQLAELLDREFGEGDPPSDPVLARTWSDTTPPPTEKMSAEEDGGWVRASMTITTEGVELTTMSEERHERYVAKLLALLPDAQLVDEHIEPLDWDELGERAGGQRFGAGGTGGMISPDDPDLAPELAELLQQHIRKMEAEWIHEQIPALGGLTPTEARDDPTRREDLERLLNTMPNSPNGFDSARLRTLLQMDDGPGFD